ncbi:MAG: hypothetical protein HC945_01215 [Nitrosarchaeum sp.]|nr:hypothetical protein [Nitrosarchaeum sp.]
MTFPDILFALVLGVLIAAQLPAGFALRRMTREEVPEGRHFLWVFFGVALLAHVTLAFFARAAPALLLEAFLALCLAGLAWGSLRWEPVMRGLVQCLVVFVYALLVMLAF